ncbi:TetR/AcrR family transcriptional regulator [Alkalihalobacterium chitinilyticum]|uniref:TetR/AcrR family transcriptional regulator n=1 Tax=Alkalihalobacterium chitinilyticum TaxID=2980103 RepID=A0ABT5VIU9_9BACI|nr:TetR/AcrR family transcriptional regulator [Alkalihalobacterium chitinilyticum]MDE5414373.1 TetR/AcrR family transcriptional regulator [Alkalihalobacterium chitinilyticum]
MPPKKKFSQSQIIDAAFEIAKNEGHSHISIRKVADRLGSSIAPIYVNFTDVEDLKRAVMRKVMELSEQKIKEQNSGNTFKDLGIASLRFAEEYPVLVRDLALNPNEYIQEYDQEMDFVSLMKQDPELAGFTDEELMMIFLKMRAFQLGLTMMVANRLLPKELTMDQMIELSGSAAEDIISATRLRKEKDNG